MIATYRYVPAEDATAEKIDDLNQRVMERLQYSGRVYPSNAVVDGRFVLRACIVNYRSEAEDIEALVDLTVQIGDELVAATSDRGTASRPFSGLIPV